MDLTSNEKISDLWTFLYPFCLWHPRNSLSAVRANQIIFNTPEPLPPECCYPILGLLPKTLREQMEMVQQATSLLNIAELAVAVLLAHNKIPIHSVAITGHPPLIIGQLTSFEISKRERERFQEILRKENGQESMDKHWSTINAALASFLNKLWLFLDSACIEEWDQSHKNSILDAFFSGSTMRPVHAAPTPKQDDLSALLKDARKRKEIQDAANPVKRTGYFTTIMNSNPSLFDHELETCLRDGWNILRLNTLCNPTGIIFHIAYLERLPDTNLRTSPTPLPELD